MASTVSGIKFEQRGKDHDLTIYQGKTINFSLVWGGNSPIDVTGFSARMQIRPSLIASTEAEFTVDNSRVSVGTINGLFTFSMSATDSAALSAGNYFYDIEIIDDSGNVFLALSGSCEIIGEVTK